jgi:transposase-like protein/transcription elongation factor Elf1
MGVNMSVYTEIDFFRFQERFQTEEQCFEYLKNLRWPNGFICPQCGHGEAYFTEKRKLFQCKNCRHQTSVTAQTLFHRTHVPLRKWFWAIYLVGSDKRGCSAKRLETMLDVNYVTAWLMVHKIRKAMEDRETRYQLGQVVEMDEAFFGGPFSGKRGRGAENKSKVIVAVENRGTSAGYAKMTVVETLDGDTIRDVSRTTIRNLSTIRTDDYPAYTALAKHFQHRGKTVKSPEAKEKLPWVHILIGNAKTFIRGTYHGVSHKHLQRYLNEFCYRFNRRLMESEIFDRILVASLSTCTLTFAELTQ